MGGKGIVKMPPIGTFFWDPKDFLQGCQKFLGQTRHTVISFSLRSPRRIRGEWHARAGRGIIHSACSFGSSECAENKWVVTTYTCRERQGGHHPPTNPHTNTSTGRCEGGRTPAAVKRRGLLWDIIAFTSWNPTHRTSTTLTHTHTSTLLPPLLAKWRSEPVDPLDFAPKHDKGSVCQRQCGVIC